MLAGYNQSVIEATILTAIRARLAVALASPCEKYRPFCVGNNIVGWVGDERARRLAHFSDVFAVDNHAVAFLAPVADAAARTAALAAVAARLAAEGELTAWRNERYPVALRFGDTPLFLLERAAARYFGIRTYAAHVNGIVAGTPLRMWVARRSAAKAIDPGLLDNLIGGGIAAGVGVAATVLKEAWEEAGIPATFAREAIATGAVHVCRTCPDGLQWETIFTHDLWLSPEFVPHCQDGEAIAHRLVDLPEAARLIALAGGADVVTADASLVILDCLLRHGLIAPDAPDYLALEALRHSAAHDAPRA